MNVQLRQLKSSDASLMLEWMHDDNVVHYLKRDFLNTTIEECRGFIDSARNQDNNLHLAVTDEYDEYMGTVSLKEIRRNKTCNSGEFAITMRKSAMGKGCAAKGMELILQEGFSNIGLDLVYWCVQPENARAVKFYDKNGYQRIELEKLIGRLGTTIASLTHGEYKIEDVVRFIWYAITKEEYMKRKANRG